MSIVRHSKLLAFVVSFVACRSVLDLPDVGDEAAASGGGSPTGGMSPGSQGGAGSASGGAAQGGMQGAAPGAGGAIGGAAGGPGNDVGGASGGDVAGGAGGVDVAGGRPPDVDGGSAGAAGVPTGATSSAGGSASGGSASGGSASGGHWNGGTTHGGDGGSAGAAGAAGDSGHGGRPTEPTFKEPGSKCFVTGALGCTAPGSPVRAVCKSGQWTKELSLTCPVAFTCDPALGACTVSCTPTDLVCRSDSRAICENGILRYAYCPFGCSQNACADGPDGVLAVDAPPSIGVNDNTPEIWPTSVSVCFGGDAANTPESHVIRNELNDTWGRYTRLSFLGFESCDESDAAVEVNLVEHCRDRLGGISRYGYPGPDERIQLEICASYWDGNEEVLASDSVLRFMTRHEFGHLLGQIDDGNSFMVRYVTPAAMDALAFPSESAAFVKDRYPPAPPQRLARGGNCVVGSSAGLAASIGCQASNDERLAFDGTNLRSIDAGLCAVASPEGELSLAECQATGEATPDATWYLQTSAWRGDRSQCVEFDGSGLKLGECEAGAERQGFDLEFIGMNQGRIGCSIVRQCVRRPTGEIRSGNYPELGDCDGIADVFEITDSGQLRVDGYCLEGWAYSNLTFKPCGASIYQRWFLSGRIINMAGGVLSLSSAGATPELRVVPNSGSSADQLFDYHL